MVDFNTVPSGIERPQSLMDRLRNASRPGPTFPGTPVHSFQDRRDAQAPAAGQIPETHDLLFREPRTLGELIHETVNALGHKGSLADRSRALATFSRELNAVDGYLTSY